MFIHQSKTVIHLPFLKVRSSQSYLYSQKSQICLKEHLYSLRHSQTLSTKDFSKILEKLVYKTILKHLNSYNILYNYQYRFHKKSFNL